MASRPSCPSEKKVLMRKANLSSTVLDYYNKFGQNRDLEKYLRLRRQNSSKSSSDGSLYNFERTNTAAETERVRKSLQKLNVSDGKDAKVASATPDANAVEASSGARGKPTEKSSAATGEQIKIQKILRKKSKSKSYNVSMESNIEINMPPPPPSYSLPELTNRADLTTADSLKSMPKQLQFQSCETQTASPLPSDIPQSTTQVTPIDGSQVVPHVVEQVVAQVVESVVKSKPTTEECAVETSPASSIASAKTRLEWDSMADVGYKQIIDFKSKSNSNLSTFEKDALTKFFARRGLNFDDKLVIIASPDERTKLQKRKITKSAIEMRQKSYNESWRSFSKPDKNNKRDEEPTTSRSGRGHWKMALMKYQEKYGRAPETDETLQPPSDSLQLSQPQGHSTPFTIEASGTSAGGDDPKLHNRAEKSCQTSYSQLKIERKQSVASVGIQIDIGEVDRIEPEPTAEEAPSGRVERSTQSSDPNMTSSASFEYVAGKSYINSDDPLPIEENVPGLNRSDSIPVVRNDNMDNNEAELEAEVEEKENVPPVEDKENIPPPKCYSRIEGGLVTPEQNKSVVELQSSVEDSMLSIELQRGIDLLNALIDSKKLDREAKKKLTRKIVRRLMKSSSMSEIMKLLRTHDDSVDQCDESSATNASKSAASDQKTISGVATLSSTGISVEVVLDQSAGNDQKIEKQDEIVHEWLKPATRSEIEKERRPKTTTQPIRTHTEYAAIDLVNAAPQNIREFIEVEKQNHFKWIDQEIEHLRNLKALMVQSDLDKDQLGSSRSLPARMQETLENVEAARPATSAVDSNSLKGKSSASEHEHRWNQPSACSANESDRPRTSNSTSDECRRNFPKWNSHLNMQQLVKNRTKLQTPSSDESIQSYAKARHAEFNRNYAKAQGILYGNASRVANVYEQPIYTKPYSSDDYSDCGNRGLRKILPAKSNNNANAYTSITGSGGFLSSNSVSIAVAANSTSNTTTHQYDTKISAGVQTSDTLQRMQPIRMRRIAAESPPKLLDESRPTMRVHKFTLNKQQQMRPEPLAYVITFKEKGRNRQTDGDSGRSNEKQFDSDDIDTDEHFTLQQYLQLRKPEFVSIAEERRKSVNRMHYLRHERNQQRKKLLASYTTSSTLKMNMKRLLPPPPLAQTRLFSSKDIKANTRRKYRKLPEILQKKCAEKEEKIRKNHRTLATIFNKNLQRRVLTGKTDLSNSMTITC